MKSSRPLRFLHLTTFYPPYSFGGDAVYLQRLAHALADDGHDVDVVHCLDAYDLLHPRPPEMRAAEHPRVTRHPLRSKARWLSPLLTQLSGRPVLKRRALEKILREKPYDVVHFHNVSLLGLTALDCAALQPRAVTAYTAHEYWLVCPTHMLWKLGRRACERPQCIRCQIAAGRPPQLWRRARLFDAMASRVDVFFAPTRFAAQMHAERGFARPMTELPYFAECADADWHTPAPRPHARPYFLFVGRLEPPKGVDTLIDAWNDVEQADLLIAGTGSEENALRRQAAPNPRVRFLGPIPESDLGPLYFHALACVVPTLAYETFAMVIIEAFSRKTPVIVHDVGPPPEIARESGGGLAYRDKARLIECVSAIAHSPALRAELGENGYRAYRRAWTRAAHLERYFDHLRATARAKLGGVPWEDDFGAGDRDAAAAETNLTPTVSN
jgi:glycosyltransferase involved in cell wall biosynthesis